MLQFYLCGSNKVATAVKAKLTKLIAEVKEVDEEKASEIFREIMNGRFATDIFE